MVLEKIFKFRHVFSLFRNFLPLEKDWALYLNKFEFPLPKDALGQVWLKLAQWFWRRFFNFVNVFSLFRNYSPLEKGGALHLNKLTIIMYIPSTQECFVPSFIEISSLILEKKSKMWKVYRRTDRQADGRQAIRKAHFSFQLRWA